MSDTKAAKTAEPWEKLGITTLPMSSVKASLELLWGMDQKITMCLMGDTGVGKTPIVAEWVREKGGYLQTLNLGHMNSDDVSMSMFNDEGTRYNFVKPEWIHKLNEEADRRGIAVLFLDEWNRGSKDIVNSLFTLPDERRIHDFVLHKNVLIVAAMNPSDGSYLVNQAERDPAIRKRLNFVYVTPDLAGWLRWGAAAKLHPLVLAFVRGQPALFYDVAARDAGKAFPCPSNWEKVSNLIYSAEKIKDGVTSHVLEVLITGQVGYVAAKKFMDFVRDANTLIQPSEIIDGYKKGGRARVAHLLGCRIVNGKMEREKGMNIRADVLATLNEGIALTLYTLQPDPKTIVENLGDYLVDIPLEFYVTFVSEYMKKYTSTVPKGVEYTMNLSQLLNQNPAWKARMIAMAESHKEISEGLKK